MYAQPGVDAETIRDQLIQKYGSATVQEAEISTVLDVLMIAGVLKPSEFIDLIQKKLSRIEQMRYEAALVKGSNT
jgi:hypothetical protein